MLRGTSNACCFLAMKRNVRIRKNKNVSADIADVCQCQLNPQATVYFSRLILAQQEKFAYPGSNHNSASVLRNVGQFKNLLECSGLKPISHFTVEIPEFS
jgi:hypothetical protein